MRVIRFQKNEPSVECKQCTDFWALHQDRRPRVGPEERLQTVSQETQSMGRSKNLSRPQRGDSMQSPHPGSSTGVCAGSPTGLPTGPASHWPESLCLGRTGTDCTPHLGCALQIHFLGHLILTLKGISPSKNQGSAEQSRGQEDVSASHGNGQLHPLPLSRGLEGHPHLPAQKGPRCEARARHFTDPLPALPATGEVGGCQDFSDKARRLKGLF